MWTLFLKAYAFGGTGACGFFGASANFINVYIKFTNIFMRRSVHPLFITKVYAHTQKTTGCVTVFLYCQNQYKKLTYIVFICIYFLTRKIGIIEPSLPHKIFQRYTHIDTLK